MKIKTLLITLVFIAMSVAVFARNAKTLENGYKIDPAGTQLASILAKVIRGYYKLVKTENGCESVAVRFTDLDENDSYYMHVVRLADRNGNNNGTAEYSEMKAYYDLACENRGE